MPIGFVAQSQAQLTAAEHQVNEAQEDLRIAHSNLRDLKSEANSPDRELSIIAQQAYLVSLEAVVKDRAAALEAVRQEHTNVLARRRRQAEFVEHAERELKRVQRHDPARLLAFETALRDLVEHAQGITYARDFVNVIANAENERRDVAQALGVLERNRAGLAAFDGVPDVPALPLEPTPAGRPARVKAA